MMASQASITPVARAASENDQDSVEAMTCRALIMSFNAEMTGGQQEGQGPPIGRPHRLPYLLSRA